MDLSFFNWIEHAGFIVKANRKTLYIDPFNLRARMERADVIFITHSHFDHMSEKDIKMISDSNTQFVAPKETAQKLNRSKVLAVEPGKGYEIDGIGFRTVAAYNTKADRLEFHPKSNGWVGYVIDADGTRLCHSGDTDLTEEMKKVETEMALLNMGGKYTMGVDEAIEAANMIKAKAVAPMHYKTLLGKEGSADAEGRFKKEVKNGIILKQLQEPHFSF